GKTTAPKPDKPSVNQESAAAPSVNTKDLLNKAKTKLSPEQNDRIASLENAVTRGDVKGDMIHVYHQLAKFWKDSAHIFEPYA
ncbi:hypothetical protein ABTL56_19825, partial [Acinetobacter baumannii]